MRLPTLLVSTAVLAAATVTGASAQTAAPASKTKKDATATAPSPYRSSSARQKTSRSYVPPAPAIPRRPSSRVAAASHKALGSGMVGIDQTGRIDKSGRSVNFYPSIRGNVPTTPKQSASRNAPASQPHENAQKVKR